MKHNAVRFIIFAVLFVLLFAFFTELYVPAELEYVGRQVVTKFTQFYNEPEDTLDVLFFGTSIVDSAFFPAVMWDEAGISSYNLSLGAAKNFIMYYWLKEALKYQMPSVVVINARFLFDDERFLAGEARFREGMDYMRMSPNKIEAIMEIISYNSEHKLIDYLFPLLRYHDRKTLTEDDFSLAFRKERNPVMGAHMYLIHQERGMPVYYWDPARNSATVRIEDVYLKKMVALCKENNIKTVLVDLPASRYELWSLQRHETAMEWAEKNGVEFVDFNMRDLWEEIGFDEAKDFADLGHANVAGATKISRYFARWLAEHMNLSDRRLNPYDPHWDYVTEFYRERYDKFTADIEAGTAAGPGDLPAM